MKRLLMAGLCLALIATVIPVSAAPDPATLGANCDSSNIVTKGATFPAQAMKGLVQAWESTCEFAPVPVVTPTPASLTYCGTGSGTGINAFLGRQTSAADEPNTNKCTTNGIEFTSPTSPVVNPTAKAFQSNFCAGAKSFTVECVTFSTFANSDATLNAGDLTFAASISTSGSIATSKPLTLPWAVGPVAVIYNVPVGTVGCLAGVPPGILLTANDVVTMYTTAGFLWSGLAASNPALATCNIPVAPVYRGDSSGTTFAFTNYLSVATSGAVGINKVFTTAVPGALGTPVLGNPAVVNAVKTTVGAFGYADFGDVLLGQPLAFASLQANAPGGAVYQAPSAASCASAAAAASVTVQPDPDNAAGWVGFNIVYQPGAYPACTYTYFLAWQHAADVTGYLKVGATPGDWTCGDYRAAQEFLTFANSPAGQGIVATTPGFAPVDPLTQAKNLAAIASMSCTPGGATPLVGGPTCDLSALAPIPALDALLDATVDGIVNNLLC